ncbi:MAG: DoxX family protein [Gemmatimonadaceae bacterium]
MKTVWTGRVLSAIPVVMLLFASVIKLMRSPEVMQGFAEYGFPANLVVLVGALELGCVIVYLIPRTAVLGAILMTALFGGATVTNVRVHNPGWIAPVLLGVLAWAGLYLRDVKLRALIPLRKPD